jgi:hypothetical protein
MKIVQSFWSAKKNLINDSFGWLSPMHHIMGWTLSCLKLKEQYDDLHLYTDENGYKLLIEYMQLPYKSVQVCFDNLDIYNEHFWAISKIATYAAQNGPFIHVDGDVFIWKKFDPQLENARLVAQNLETGTDYYKRMFNGIKRDLGFAPDCLLKELERDSIFSYNAGILGGNDPRFFENYYATAIKLIQHYQPLYKQELVSGNFNILFEQILFHALAKDQKIDVTCYFKRQFTDKGYEKADMADFMLTPCRLKYLHLIGKYKRDAETCDLLARTLLREYPQFFFKVISLFHKQHNHFQTRIRPLMESMNVYTPDLSVNGYATEYFQTQNTAKEVSDYRSILEGYAAEWEGIDEQLLYELEVSGSRFYSFFCEDRDRQLSTVFYRHPFIRIVEASFSWSQDVMDVLFPRLHCDLSEERYGIACIPDLFTQGYREVVIDEMQYDMLAIFKERLTLHELIEGLQPVFCEEDLKENYDIIYQVVMIRLKHLLHHKCIYIQC